MRLLGIELGGDQLTAVTVDERGDVLGRSREKVTNDDVTGRAQNAARVARATGRLDAAGITIPYATRAVPEVVASTIAAEAETAPVTISAGNAMALAEAWCGAARGASNIVSFAIGEHVTAGIIADGRVLTGAHGHAAAVAWLALNPVEREDYRRHGSLEAEVAAAGIVRRLVWRIKSGDRSRVTNRVAGDLSRLTADDVLASAREGDGVCVSVIRDTAKYVGMAIANLATVLDPECIVLGGTLASSGDLMLDAIRGECLRRVSPAQAERVRIVLSTLGDDAAAIGAARAAHLRHP